jgi:hypothetical protein
MKIPNNLVECFVELMKSKPKEVRLLSMMDPLAFHHTTGMFIRNKWGLWKGKNSLVKFFNVRGIYHPNDMSSIILVSFHRLLNNQNINLQEQIDVYINFWKNKGFKDGNSLRRRIK